MFTYVAYGLRICSPFNLTGLSEVAPGDAPVNITVRYGAVDRAFEEPDSQGRDFWCSDREACYFYSRSGKYLVRDGREIIVDPVPGAPEMLIRLSLIGPALGLALIQRGYFLLHASSMAVDGSGVAFLGGHAWGKSTLAASLHSIGHRFVADDLTAIQLERTEEPLIIPSFPHFKLWPDTVEALGEAVDQLPELHPTLNKRQLCVPHGFDGAPVPLNLLCVLNKGPAVDMQQVEPDRAVTELLRHWYGARYGPQLVKSMNPSSHFLRCAHLARRVPLVRLVRPATEDPTEVEFAKAVEAVLRRELRGESCSRGTPS